MADTYLRLIKRFAEFLPASKVDEVPTKRRGIYVLYKHRVKARKSYYDVVYVGMTTAGMKSRLKSHRKSKRKKGLWTHFSAFEVWDNVRDEEIRELEGLFRHLYRKDTRANALNRQRRFARAVQAQQNSFDKWK